MKKPKRRGDVYYKKLGLTKPLLIHVSPELHGKLSKLADAEERSLQVTVRRILEKYVGLRDEG
jgi:predicted transcriptional regulator